MTLIQSISGMRGTLGGKPGEGLTPVDIMRFTGAYGMWLKSRPSAKPRTVVIGRDARISGPMVSNIVSAVLQAMGIHVIDGGVIPTPTVAMGVSFYGAHGGIIITASHNPKHWNALKFLDARGEFLKLSEAAEVQQYMDMDLFVFATLEKLGKYSQDDGLLAMHIERILSLPLVDTAVIKAADFKVVVDAVNSCGGSSVPLLLKALGVTKVVEVFCQENGHFPHNPEPLPENLVELSQQVITTNAHLGFAVDPDVDRLAIVCEDGDFFGEEYTLVAVADYVLSQNPGNAVSNLSSTQALKEVTESHGGIYFASAVGEANVVEVMKKYDAVIGGEGNGGVIYPPLHYGRDALVGIALFLTSLAKSKLSCTAFKKKLPEYYISKNKVELPADTNMDEIFSKLEKKYGKQPKDMTDGIKIWFDKEWVHLRKSNTEPIIRIYAESNNMVTAENLSRKIILDIRELLKEEVED